MNTLAKVLDAESYEWLGGHHPETLLPGSQAY
jgi:hypothetical protein